MLKTRQKLVDFILTICLITDEECVRNLSLSLIRTVPQASFECLLSKFLSERLKIHTVQLFFQEEL